MFGWVKGSGFLSKVVEKTKSVTENVITTLDPQMKEFIHSGGDIEVVVTSDKEDKVVPVREAFQEVFGQATVYGLASKCVSIAEQPVGFASGKQAALERISTLRKSGWILLRDSTGRLFFCLLQEWLDLRLCWFPWKIFFTRSMMKYG